MSIRRKTLAPGRPLFYATAMAFAGSAVGLLVESHAGRPTKVEGNPDHPASLGATDIFHQASVLTLYDPDRSQTVTALGQHAHLGRGPGRHPRCHAEAAPTARRRAAPVDAKPSSRRRSPGKSKPLLKDLARGQVARLRADSPGHGLAGGADGIWRSRSTRSTTSARPTWCFRWMPTSCSAVREASATRPTSWRGGGSGRPSRMPPDGADESALRGRNGRKLHRRQGRPSAGACGPARSRVWRGPLATKLGVATDGETAAERYRPLENGSPRWPRTSRRHRGRCLVLAGDRQPPVVHLLAHAINDHLGNVGQTVTYTAPIDARPGDRTQSLRELVEDMEQGRVELLVILGGNPVYTAPADLNFAEHLQKVPLRIHHGLYRRRDLVPVPLAPARGPLPGSLERCAGLRRNGVDRAALDRAAVPRPVRPRSAGAAGRAARNSRPGDRPRALAKALGRPAREGIFEQFWQQALHDGVIPGTAFQPKRSSSRKAGKSHCELMRRAESGRAAEREKRLPSRARLPKPHLVGEGRSWKSSSSRTRRSTTARGPITAGSRNCPSRSRNSPGATPPS